MKIMLDEGAFELAGGMQDVLFAGSGFILNRVSWR